MLSRIHKLGFLFTVLIGFLIQAPLSHASSQVLGVDDVITTLNKQDHRNFLLSIASGIYERDKNDTYVQEKMCTHGGSVVQAWKEYSTAPRDIKSSRWRSMKQRGVLVIFTTPNIQNIIPANLINPTHVIVRKMKGDSYKKIVLALIFEASNTIGKKYLDTAHGDKMGRKNAGLNYDESNLNLVKLLFDITDIIEKIQTDGDIKDKDEYSSFGKIATICPAEFY